MEMFLRDLVVGRHETGLVSDAYNREVALRIKDGDAAALEAGIGVIEDTRGLLRFGRVNRRNSLRDMALRLRTGGN
jgi:hypothetical protein